MLSEEEKEAIEFIKFYQQHCLKKEKENMKQYETVNDEEFVSKNLDTVLNLITKLQKEIQDYKYLYEQALDNTMKADKENIQLKKQINLMAEYIATLDIEEDICKNIKNDNCDKMNFGECEYCIKQYFERKVKDD